MNTRRLLATLAGSLVLLALSATWAEDWPQWRGPNRDGKVVGFTAPAAWPKTLTQKWKTTVGLGDSSPCLVGGKIYAFARVGDEEVLTCLDAATGKELWKTPTPAPATAGPSAREHAGPRSAPAVADGKVVTLGVNGAVTCFDAATGKQLWRKDDVKAVPRFYTAMSPIIVDGLAIVHLGGNGSGTIFALDLATGTPKWKYDGPAPAYASPALLIVGGIKQVVEETDNSILSVGVADGKKLWEIPYPAAGRMAYNAPTPLIDGDTVYYTGQGRGTTAVKIEKDGDAFKPKELWKNPDLGCQFASPVVKDGLLYGLSDKKVLFCLNAATGKTAWTDTAARGGTYGAMLDAGAVIFALPSNSTLLAFKPGDKAYEELAAIKVADTPTYAYPVIDGNKIYIKDKDSITLLTLE